jgi:anti-sigma factor RsiW
MTHPASRHATIEGLLSYFDGQLPDPEECAIELHISECDACAEVGQEICALEQVWAGWTAQRHGQLHLRVMLALALAKAQEHTTDPSWRERLKGWREVWAGTAEAALRTVLHAPAEASRVVAAGLDSLSRPGSFWQFAAEPTFAGTLGEGDEEESTIFATSRLSPESPRALVELRGGDKGGIVVRIDNLSVAGTPPLVVLIAIKPSRELIVQVTEVKRQPGTNSFVARFTKVPPGEYIVAFEPLEASPGRGP